MAKGVVGSLIRDRNRVPVQAASAFVTQDNTGTPQVSPLAYTALVTTIVVPDKAVEMIVNPSTAMRISEVVGMAQYDVIAANTKEAIQCVNMSNIYVTRDSVSGTLNFRFTIIS